jgi:hypothetical protein
MMVRLMKWLVIIGTFTACVLAIMLVSPRPAVSLTFLEYKRWPHGAMLRLTNGTQITIQYRAEPDSGPPVFLMRTLDGKVRGASGHFTTPDLRPGKAVDFFVLLEPDSAPVRVGTICTFPQTRQTRLALKLQPRLFRLKRRLGLQMAPPGQKEAWCPKPLSVNSSRQPPVGS